jgi:UDP-N-acetylglucosamine 2-epimerase (non-hydrolysing)
VTAEIPLIVAVHPRTRARLQRKPFPGVKLADPMGDRAFLDFVEHAAVVITESGGIQEETTALDVPCITLRTSTERPVTVRLGTNRLVGENVTDLRPAVQSCLSEGPIPPTVPFWDGHAA